MDQEPEKKYLLEHSIMEPTETPAASDPWVENPSEEMDDYEAIPDYVKATGLI